MLFSVPVNLISFNRDANRLHRTDYNMLQTALATAAWVERLPLVAAAHSEQPWTDDERSLQHSSKSERGSDRLTRMLADSRTTAAVES